VVEGRLASLAGAEPISPGAPGATLTGFDVTLHLTGIIGITPTIFGLPRPQADPHRGSRSVVREPWVSPTNGCATVSPSGGATASTLTLTAQTSERRSLSQSPARRRDMPRLDHQRPDRGCPGSPLHRVERNTDRDRSTLVGRTLTRRREPGPAPVSLPIGGIAMAPDPRRQPVAIRELTDRDAGHPLTVTVTGSKRGFAPSSATSATTALVWGSSPNVDPSHQRPRPPR
jgi:hypothetical protein